MKSKNRIDISQMLPLIDGDWYLWLGFQGRGWLQYSDAESNFINEGGIIIDKIDTTHLFTPKQVFRHFTNYPTPPDCLKELESKILSRKAVKSLKSGAEYNQLVESKQKLQAKYDEVHAAYGATLRINTELKSEIENKDLAIVALLEKIEELEDMNKTQHKAIAKLHSLEAADHDPELIQLNHELTRKLAQAKEDLKQAGIQSVNERARMLNSLNKSRITIENLRSKLNKANAELAGPLATYINGLGADLNDGFITGKPSNSNSFREVAHIDPIKINFKSWYQDQINAMVRYQPNNNPHDLAIVRCINPDQLHDVFKLYCAITKQAIHKHSRGRDTRAVYEQYIPVPTGSEQLFPNLLTQRAEIVKGEGGAC